MNIPTHACRGWWFDWLVAAIGLLVLAVRLHQKYQKEIAQKHNLTVKQVEEIVVEGMVKNWTYIPLK